MMDGARWVPCPRCEPCWDLSLSRGEPIARFRVRCFQLFSELEAHGELQLSGFCPRWFAGNEDRPLINIDRRGISIRVAGVDVVKRVIGIQPELREQALMEGEILLHRHVRIKEVRTELRIPARVPIWSSPGAEKFPCGPFL